MADKQDEPGEDQARKELAQEKLLKAVIDVLRENREALCHLPEMLEHLIEMSEANVEKAIATGSSDESRMLPLQRELQMIEKEKADKEERIVSLEKEKAEKEKNFSEKEDRYEDLKKYNKTLKTRNDDLIRDIGSKEEELKDQAEKLDQLTDLYKTTVSSKDRDIDQLKSRVASLSEKRVKQDQSKVEDTLSLNSQSKLEEDFANFIDEARMDARERIQAIFRSNENINVEIYFPRLACLIFEATYERMKEARKAIVEIFTEMSRGMIHSAPEMSRQFTLNEKARIPSFQVNFRICILGQELQYPTDVFDALMLTLKETAPNCNLDCFVEDVIQVVWSKWCSWHSKERLFKLSPNTSLLRDPKILKYINACIRLTWRMVTQFPPLQIEYSSLYLKDIHMKRGYHSSPDMRTRVKGSSGPVQGEEIACYLWPGLLDGGGRLIRAGEVLCKIKDER